jgi:hypothetical protein
MRQSTMGQTDDLSAQESQCAWGLASIEKTVAAMALNMAGAVDIMAPQIRRDVAR